MRFEGSFSYRLNMEIEVPNESQNEGVFCKSGEPEKSLVSELQNVHVREQKKKVDLNSWGTLDFRGVIFI